MPIVDLAVRSVATLARDAIVDLPARSVATHAQDGRPGDAQPGMPDMLRP